ncbi:hypothetical protein [Mycobacterium sp.]
MACVVGCKTGSRVLRTGHLVEVDGTTGRSSASNNAAAKEPPQ